MIPSAQPLAPKPLKKSAGNLYDPSVSYVPNPIQDIFHKSPCMSRLIYGANKSGKSRGGIVESIWWALGIHPYRTVPVPSYGWIISQDFSQSRGALLGHKGADERFAEFTLWLKNFGIVPKELRRQEHVVVFENKSVIEFKSSASGESTFQALKIHWIHYDEEPDEDVFVESQLRLVDYNGAWWMTMTATKGAASWTNEDFWQNKGRPFKQKNAVGNPIAYYNKELDQLLINPSIYDNRDASTGKLNLPEARVKYLEATLTAAHKSIRLIGIPAMHEGLVFGECWDATKHVINHFDIPRSWPRYIGIDWGYSEAHPFVCVWLTQSPDGVWYLYDELTVTRGAAHIWSDGIKAKNAGQEIQAGICDPRGGERVEDMGNHGIYLQRGKAGQGDLEARYDTLTELLFLDKFFVLRNPEGQPTAPTFISNMSKFAWPKMDGRRKTPSTRPRPLFNDAIDAAGYVLLERFEPPQKEAALVLLTPAQREAKRLWASLEKEDKALEAQRQYEKDYGEFEEGGDGAWIM